MSFRKSHWRNKKRREELLASLPKEPDTSARIGQTDLKNKNVQIYLVKMPAFLAEQFEARGPGTGEVVARMRIPGPDNKPKVENEGDEEEGRPAREKPRIFLDKVCGTKDTPKESVSTEYDVEFQAENPKMMVFSQNRQGEEVDMRMEGVVSFLCSARPKFDSKYRGMNKRRTMLSMQKSREVLRMDDSARKAADREALKPMSMTETAKQREVRKKQKEDSRRHLDVPDEKWREMARVDVFKAFEIQGHYTADELAKVIGEPLNRLRSVITEVCVYNKSGPFSGLYELKDEFKTVAQREQKERDLESHRLAQIELVKKRREERAERERQDGPASKKSRLS